MSGTPATPAAASIFAVELLAGLIRRGISDIVVCPGSRSQALALAAAAAEESQAIRLHVRVDERSAAFFALGLARETGLPAPVIVTSGTAVANLLPAALEAHEARVPFIALTADRPQAQRGVRTSQTTKQFDMFGRAARLSLDVAPPAFDEAGGLSAGASGSPDRLAAQALAASLGSLGNAPAGPVQLNLQFTEPLSGTRGFDRMIAAGFEQAGEEGAEAREFHTKNRSQFAHAAPGTKTEPSRTNPDAPGTNAELSDTAAYIHGGDADSTDPLTVVIAGAGAGDEAEQFARDAGLPLLAEVVSGSRYGREAITAYATLLDDPLVGGLTERAIVFGHPTLTRQVPALLAREDVEAIVVDPHTLTDHFDPARGARVVRTATVAETHDARLHRRWLGAWIAPDRELRAARSSAHVPDLEAARATGYKERSAYARSEVAVRREPVTREMLAENTWLGTWPHDRIVLASSRLVRVLDSLAPARKLTVHSNRGLAGIDGTIATALGIASASQSHPDPARAAGTTRVLIGDLAMFHDAGSLLLPPERELTPRIQLLVGNDNGGTIFDGLEVAESASTAAFDRVMLTPQSVDLAHLAKAYGWSYQLIETRVDLERIFTTPVTGPSIVEVKLPRE